MSYAFTFDASACSGCKTCQEACKDKNDLPTGLLWRRVIEVSGGDWRRAGESWENNIFAYNLSLACNHCVHPKCAGVCPTDAYTVRPDGIVLLDSSRCMGCGYCAWACPYSAPQFDAKRGVMTKCDFCYDYLDAGMPPSCVAACPLRVLNVATVEELSTPHPGLDLWQLPATEHPFPLPNYSRTEPHLVVKPHTGMNSPLEKMVSNQEELHPPRSFEDIHRTPAIHELPLVGFSLLAQMAAGIAICSLVLSPFPLPLLQAIGILLGGGGLISFLHLGRKRNAWRSVIHLKKSWLSREILMAGLFGAAWALTMGWYWLKSSPPNPWPMALLGLGLLYCMAQVYHLRAVAAWNNWRTLAAFLLSAITLGALGVNMAAPHAGWLMVTAVGLIAELSLMLTKQPTISCAAGRLRLALLGLGMAGALFVAILPRFNQPWLVVPIFIIALAAEAIGRWQFYTWRVPFPVRTH